jgi:hypothetical protein
MGKIKNKKGKNIMNNTNEFMEEADYEVIPYHGYDIYYNYYKEGEFTVNFNNEDWWYKTLDDAKKAIDS